MEEHYPCKLGVVCSIQTVSTKQMGCSVTVNTSDFDSGNDGSIPSIPAKLKYFNNNNRRLVQRREQKPSKLQVQVRFLYLLPEIQLFLYLLL